MLLLSGFCSLIGDGHIFAILDDNWRKCAFGRDSALASVGSAVVLTNVIGPGGWGDTIGLNGVITVVQCNWVA